MVYHIDNKNLLFIEPCLSFLAFIEQAKIKGYGTFIVSANDAYLTLPTKNFTASSTFFQLDTRKEESVLALVKQISKKFKIDGVIPGNESYGSLAAKIAAYLKTPILGSENVLKLQHTLKEQESLTSQLPAQKYHIEGVIRNSAIYVLAFTEKLFSHVREGRELGYIAHSSIHQISLSDIENYLEEIIADYPLDLGVFYAQVGLSEQGLTLLNFSMRIAKGVMPRLVHYATGIDYYDSMFKLFSGHPLALYRTKHLNAGVVFFYKDAIKEKNFSHYLEILLQDPLVVEVEEYSQEIEQPKIGHAILVHQDYATLKHHVEKIAKFPPL